MARTRKNILCYTYLERWLVNGNKPDVKCGRILEVSIELMTIPLASPWLFLVLASNARHCWSAVVWKVHLWIVSRKRRKNNKEEQNWLF